MPNNVVSLPFNERLAQDSGRITAIYSDLGAVSGDQVVARALSELALTMSRIVDLSDMKDLTDLSRKLRRIQSVSDNLGMTSLSRVASHARDCLRHHDSTAFAAVWARLMRVAENSLASDSDLLDISKS